MDSASSRADGPVPGPAEQRGVVQPVEGGAGVPGQSALTERERAILEFERSWWRYAGAKEQAIRDLFDMSATRYYQVLNALIDRSEALAADPMLVKRLRRLRSARQRNRQVRRASAGS